MIRKEIDGTIKFYCGDTGGFEVENIPTDKNYFVFCEIRNRNGDPIDSQLMVESLEKDTVKFYIDDKLSDLLIVPFGRKFEPYSYGIKICDVNTYTEDTLNLLGLYGKPCRIIVYPKLVEGLGVVGEPCPVKNLPPYPCPPIRPIECDKDAKNKRYEKERLVTREELAAKLSKKVDEKDLVKISSEVAVLSKKLTNHIENIDIENLVTKKEFLEEKKQTIKFRICK